MDLQSYTDMHSVEVFCSLPFKTVSTAKQVWCETTLQSMNALSPNPAMLFVIFSGSNKLSVAATTD